MLLRKSAMVMSNVAPFAASIGVSGVLLGLIPGLMSITALFCRPITGWISDSMNRKKLLAISFGGLALVFAGYAVSSNAWILMAVRCAHGVMFSLCTTVNLTMVADVVPEERMTEGMGYYGLCYTLMSAVGPGLGVIIRDRFGYRFMFLLASAFYILSFLVTLSIRYEKNEVSENGFLQENKKNIWNGLFSKEALPAAAISFCNAFTNGAVVGFALLYATERGFENGGLFFTILAAVTLITRPLMGKLGDKYPPHYLVYPCDGLIVMAMLLLFIGRNPWQYYGAAAIFGLGYGGLQPLLQSMAFRAVGKNQRGAASSTFNIGLDGGNGLGPVVCSAVAGIFGSYRYGFAALILPVLLGFAIMIYHSRRTTELF